MSQKVQDKCTKPLHSTHAHTHTLHINFLFHNRIIYILLRFLKSITLCSLQCKSMSVQSRFSVLQPSAVRMEAQNLATSVDWTLLTISWQSWPVCQQGCSSAGELGFWRVCLRVGVRLSAGLGVLSLSRSPTCPSKPTGCLKYRSLRRHCHGGCSLGFLLCCRVCLGSYPTLRREFTASYFSEL